MSELTDLFGDWLVDTVQVAPHTAAGFDGPGGWGAPAPVEGCMVEEVPRLVRAATGNEVVSEATVYAPPEVATAFHLHDRVTLPSGRTSAVIRIADVAAFGLPGHVVVNLA